MKYHLVTLGCQMNKSDSERTSNVIERMGYSWTDHEEEANLLGVLACSVRQKAIDKVYTKISRWNKWKDSRNLVTFVTGCVLPDDREKFLKLFDIIFQMSELPQFPQMLDQYGVVTPFRINDNSKPEKQVLTDQSFDLNSLGVANNKEKITVTGQPVPMKKPEEKINDFWHVEPHYHSAFEAFVPIQNGCDKFCTFCAVPYTRGREISRSSDEILQEIKSLIEQDYKSVTLLGQNVNSYGLDKKGHEIGFPELLRRIGQLGDDIGKDFWLYFTSPHPRDMTDEVIEVISQYKCLAKQVHLPLQSGDDKVLIRMNRKHSLNDYRKIIQTIKRVIPEATIFTDIIVGFTGETDEQFKNTARAMDEFRFNMAYIARYSPRPGAASSRWNDDIGHEVKKKRLHHLSEILKQHSYTYNKRMIGREYKLLVVRKDRKEGYLSGLTEGRIIVRFASENNKLVGEFVKVKITSAADFATEGELIEVLNRKLIEA